MASANMATSAPCPVCSKQVPLEAMNGHIDVCLITGGPQLDEDDDPTAGTERSQKDGSLDCVTPTSASSSKKGSSPAPGGGGRGRQSVLAFGKRQSPSPGCTAGQPPTKIRKLASSTPKTTPTASQPIASIKVNADEDRSTLSDRCEQGNPTAASSSLKSSAPKELSAPLAEVMRPSSIDNYVGQEGVIGKNTILRSILESGQVPSLIFWGPPGCGKTTLARIIARVARDKQGTRFTHLSATTCGVADVKEVVKVAKNDRAMLRRKTILFIDEIHRFNKLQQDTFLTHVEDGTIILLGATTENPSFQLNSALLSRCRVIVLEKLQPSEIEDLLRRALPRIGAMEILDGPAEMTVKTGDHISAHRPCCSPQVLIDPEAVCALAQLCDGDARSALNGLQLAVQAKRTRYLQSHSSQCGNSCPPLEKTPLGTSQLNSDAERGSEFETILSSNSLTTGPQENQNGHHSGNCRSHQTTPLSVTDSNLQASCSTMRNTSLPTVTVADAKESLQRTHLLYDRAGDEHYNCISALHKSMRGSDANASLYWLARMLCAGEDPLYVARRVVRFASEDIGLADPNALPQAISAFQACQFIGKPECEVNLAQAVVYMARAPKSIEVYSAYCRAKESVKGHKGPLPSVPLHLRNAPTKLMKTLGYGKEYKYNPVHSEPVDQQYLPEGLEDMDFFS